MNVNRLKTLSWLAALGVGGYLGYFIYGFLEERREGFQEITEEEQTRWLGEDAVGKVEKPKSNIVAYKRVQAGFHELNWTGKEAPKPVEKSPEELPGYKPPLKPVADLLKVLMIQVDSVTPEGSRAVVTYTDQQLLAAAASDSELRVLRPGQKLSRPYEYIEVAEIKVEGVLFRFNGEEEREPELISTVEHPGAALAQIFKLTDGDVLYQPPSSTRITQSDNPNPWNFDEITMIGRNDYRVGIKDLEYMEANYSRILSQDVRYRQRRNPRTGQVEGLEVTHVNGGSIPERAGLAKGEVIKSINGHKVTSLNGAIAYVKKEADTTDTWIVVMEKQGREYTRTYHSPTE